MISFTSNEVTNSKNLLLTDYRLQHLNLVLGAKPGDILRVGQVDGLLGRGKVISVNSTECELELDLNTEPPVAAPIHLILALPRPKSLPRIIFAAVNMGIKKISFINSWQVEKCFWSSDYLSQVSIEQACRKGLEQSVDTLMPKIDFYRLFKPFVEDVLPGIASQSSNWMAHPYSEKLDQLELLKLRTSGVNFTLVLGPEGGFIPFEVEKFMEIGFSPFQFTNRVFKLETALPIIISQFLTS